MGLTLSDLMGDLIETLHITNLSGKDLTRCQKDVVVPFAQHIFILHFVSW